VERKRAPLIFDFLTKTDSIRPQSAFAVYTKFDFRIKMNFLYRDSVRQRAFGSGQPNALTYFYYADRKSAKMPFQTF
jgi:hypothetical protein